MTAQEFAEQLKKKLTTERDLTRNNPNYYKCPSDDLIYWFEWHSGCPLNLHDNDVDCMGLNEDVLDAIGVLEAAGIHVEDSYGSDHCDYNGDVLVGECWQKYFEREARKGE